MSKIPTRHVLQNKTIQWIISIAVYLLAFGFFMWYYYAQGYPYSLLTVNKCIALASLFSIGVAISMGPLSRFFGIIKNLLSYRRTMGMTGAYLVILHIIISVFFLQETFPLQWFMEHWICVIFCVPAFLLLLIITVLSYPRGFKFLVQHKLQFFPKLVWLAFAFALGHILFMGKIPDWIEWLKTFDTPLPHAALPASVFCIIVLLLKLTDTIFGNKPAGIQPQQLPSDGNMHTGGDVK